MTLMDKIKVDLPVGTQLNQDIVAITEIINNMIYADTQSERELEFMRYVLQERDRQGVHVSHIMADSASRFCVREQVLAIEYRADSEKKLSPKREWINLAGNMVHEMIQRMFIRSGYADATKCDKTFISHVYPWLQYSPDIICEFSTINDKPWVVEIKSMKHDEFIQNKPHKRAEEQAMLYMYISKIPQAIIMLYDKDTAEYRINVLHDVDKKRIERYIKRIQAVNEAWLQFMDYDPLPKQRDDMNESKCKYCRMRSACMSEDRRIAL